MHLQTCKGEMKQLEKKEEVFVSLTVDFNSIISYNSMTLALFGNSNWGSG